MDLTKTPFLTSGDLGNPQNEGTVCLFKETKERLTKINLLPGPFRFRTFVNYYPVI